MLSLKSSFVIPAIAILLSGTPPYSATPQDSADETIDRNLVTVTLDDVPLANVVQMFTRISGANLVFVYEPDDIADKRVTLNVEDAPWLPTLNAALKQADLVAVAKTPGSDIYSIELLPEDQRRPEDTIARLIREGNIIPEVEAAITNYAAEVMAPVLSKMITDWKEGHLYLEPANEINYYLRMLDGIESGNLSNVVELLEMKLDSQLSQLSRYERVTDDTHHKYVLKTLRRAKAYREEHPRKPPEYTKEINRTALDEAIAKALAIPEEYEKAEE